jgi:aryl-alcohol dehydrogenase-like predicted oxidoreductase
MESKPSDSKRLLGQTDLRITPIGLGMMEFSGGGGLMGAAFPFIPQEEKNATVRAGLEAGVNWFDTAELYGGGVSEASLSRALKAAGQRDTDVIIATKWWPLFRTARNIPRTIDARLQFLGGYGIGLYMVHQPFGFSSREAEMEAMADLVAAGKIRSVGVSNFSAGQMRRAHKALAKRGIPLAANEVLYSLLNRRIETNGVLQAAKELGVTIIAYTPLGFGLLSGKYHDDPGLLRRKSIVWHVRLRTAIEQSRPVVTALEEIGAKYEATPAQVALSWVINSQGDTVVSIPGVTSARQAQENAGAMHLRLSADEMARLDGLSRQFQ